MARTLGAKNIKTTDTEAKQLYSVLKKAAENGDSNAAGWLLVLKNMDGVPPLKVINGQIVETRG